MLDRHVRTCVGVVVAHTGIADASLFKPPSTRLESIPMVSGTRPTMRNACYYYMISLLYYGIVMSIVLSYYYIAILLYHYIIILIHR